LILYNVPGRTGITIAPDTVAELAKTGRFVAIKEAGGTVEAVSEIRSRCDIPILSGDDPLTVPMMSLGARGVVSVVSNLLPGRVREMVSSALQGDYSTASRIHFELLPIMRAAFIESNPTPIKAMLAHKGIIQDEVRPPLATANPQSIACIQRLLDSSA
jgi:4-hydroxy-tetrahydrodipicolinate synthase